MLNAAVIGLGGLGKLHLNNLLSLEDDIKLVALCDVEPDKLSKAQDTNQGVQETKVDLSHINFYTDAEEMLKKEELDLVVVALPTYLHAKYAIMALEAGAHVFSEKPMARTSEEAAKMIETANRLGKKLMIGQCLRFNKACGALKHFYENGELGKFVRADFHRFSLVPVWGWDHWYEDFEKSGCAALDLHVHDVDLINWVFGLPEYVSSVAGHRRTPFESISTRYFYKDGTLVTASCDWSFGNSFGFRRGYYAEFENATLEMKENGEVKVHPIEGETYDFKVDVVNPYLEEMKELISAIKEDRPVKVLVPESTKQTLDLALAEIKSAQTDEPVYL